MKLPDSLKEVLSQVEGPTVLAVGVNDLPAFIVRDNRRELRNLKRKDIPLLYQPQLSLYPTGAIFRMYIEVQDDPDKPYRGESFLNPDSADDLDLLQLFAKEKALSYFFVDEQNLVVAAKQISISDATRQDTVGMIAQAIEHNQGLGKIDYVASRQRFMRETSV